jgi:plastocyanin
MTNERRPHGRAIPVRLLIGVILVGATMCFLPGAAPLVRAADEDGKTTSAAPTRAEFSKLQAEVREQRQLIIQILQNEQQRYDMLLKLLQSQQGSGGAVPAPAAALVEPDAAPADGAGAKEVRASRGGAAAPAEKRTSFVEGKVTVSGGEGGDVYVYLDGVRGAPPRGKSIEIRQEGKQFRPRVAVVQAGTSVSFPNYDTIYHNVFSTSPRNSFDLGSHSADEKPRAVTLSSPGVVEIFCNMHQKMNANILVVPNAVYTKVRPDGSFRLDNLPVGQRWLTAWSPQSKPVRRKVEVTTSGAQVSFVLEREEPKAHTNKLGQAYGSYRE